MPTPLINGKAYSWANINLILFGSPVVGITAIEFGQKQNVVNNYGAGQYPVSRGFGNFEFSGAIEIYYEALLKIIASAPFKDIMQIPTFDIVVVFGGSGITPATVTLKGCNFIEANFASAQGDTSMKVKLPLVVALVEHK